VAFEVAVSVGIHCGKKYENCEKILVNYLTIAIQKVILFIRIL
jgi:hypothetical protein